MALSIFNFAGLMKRHKSVLIASLHDQNKNGFFGGLAFIHPIRTI